MANFFPASQPPEILKMLAHETRWQLLQHLAESDYRVQELSELLQAPTNQISYHLALLRENRLVHEHRSSADGRDVYYSLSLDQLRTQYFTAGEMLHSALRVDTPPDIPRQVELKRPVRVIFVCTHNSARSQMAEGILRFLSQGKVEVCSAGSHPGQIHPMALDTMQRSGIDISHQQSESIEKYLNQQFDYVITVCDNARETCPVFPNSSHQIHWSFPDPAAVEDVKKRRFAFEQTALQLNLRIQYLLITIQREQLAGIS